ncbi:MAG: DNA polymerase III subunit delta [Nitritalea sp.]
MPSKPEAVLKDLKAGKYAPVYFLHGEEAFFIDQISDFIEKHAIAEHEKGFNQMVMYGKDTTMPAILGNAKRFPMMAERQVVIVKEAQQIPFFGKEENEAMLMHYVQNPLPSTILVFAHKYKKLDGKKKLTKALDKHAVLVTSEKVPDYKMADWIEGYIASLGHRIQPVNAKLLADSIGNNIEVLHNEVSKLLLNFTGSIEITAEHIQQYIGINKEYNNFELTKAISVGDVVKANKIVHYFSQNMRNHPLIPILALIFTQFQKIAQTHAARGASDQDLARQLGMNPYFVKEYKIAANRYKMGKVIDIMQYLKEADLRSKGVGSGEMDEPAILKELIFKIMH